MQLFVLQIPYLSAGKDDLLSPVLLQHGKELFLIDCGYEESFPFLKEAMAKQGLSISQLTGIVLTHHDIDHVGGAFPLTEEHPTVPVYTSPVEARYISGKEKSLRLQQAEDISAGLPEAAKPAASQFIETLRNVKPVKVDHYLDETSNWPLACEVAIIATPGHTPGHFSLYVKKQKVLIAADAVVIEEGRLNLANPQYAMDLPEAIESVRKIRQLAIETLVCYHGGILNRRVPEALDDLLTKWGQEKKVQIG